MPRIRGKCTTTACVIRTVLLRMHERTFFIIEVYLERSACVQRYQVLIVRLFILGKSDHTTNLLVARRRPYAIYARATADCGYVFHFAPNVAFILVITIIYRIGCFFVDIVPSPFANRRRFRGFHHFRTFNHFGRTFYYVRRFFYGRRYFTRLAGNEYVFTRRRIYNTEITYVQCITCTSFVICIEIHQRGIIEQIVKVIRVVFTRRSRCGSPRS